MGKNFWGNFLREGKRQWVGGGGERVKIIVRHRKFCVIRINKKKFKKSINAFFFFYIFWDHLYFSFCFSILPILVPQMKNTFQFGLYRHLTNENFLRDKRSALFTHYMLT